MIENFIDKIRSSKLDTEPFKHIIINDFIPEELGRSLENNFPKESNEYWNRNKKCNTTFYKLSSNRLDKDKFLPKDFQEIIFELNSGSVCQEISSKFEINGLVSDPYLEGGGLHCIGKGGFLNIHADFNYHPISSLHRRINLLLYLNYDWKDDWGGDLQLWSKDMKTKTHSIPPRGGCCVMFETDDHSYHGHPDPMPCPSNVYRKSIALYYYNFPSVLSDSISKIRRSTVYKDTK